MAAITLAAGIIEVATLPPAPVEAAPVYYSNAAPGADRISVIGDSVMAAIRWYGTWQPLRSYNYVVDVESCRRTTAASCRGREGYQPDTTLNAMRRLSGQLGSVLVVGTGYDDPGKTFGSSIDAVMAEAFRQGIPVVIWATMRTADVTYVGPTYASNASTFRDNNRILLAKAAQYGGRLQVADWATYSASRRDWVTSDGIHLTPSGATAMAQFIANQAAVALRRVSLPSAPTLYSEVVGANEVRLAWTAPASPGRSAIIDYGYEISPDGGATWVGDWAGPAGARSVVVGGLIEGGHYQFRLLARNSVGWGAYSNTIAALTRRLAPSAPTLYSEVVGANEVRLVWTEPTSTGGPPIIDYGYEISPDGGATWVGDWAGPAGARSVVVGGLIEGGHYQFRLLARNSVGWGAYSNTIAALTRRLAPSAPTLYSEVVGANEVRLVWTEPTSTGGPPIIDYGYEISPDGGATWVGDWAGPAGARSVVVGGLIEGGHYQFRLLARNSVGWGAYSNTIVALTRRLAPSAPTLYSEVVGANEVRLVWTEPTSTGGPPIIDYGYEISPDGGATWVGDWAGPAGARSVVVGGLIEGGHYQFRLLARNSVGWGAYSNTIAALTRRLAPSAPTLYSEVVGANEVRLVWTEPTSTGGPPIIDYGYEISPDGGATWVGDWAGPAGARSVVVGGLIEGGHYQFRLLARNSVGWGAYSNTIAALTAESSDLAVLAAEDTVPFDPPPSSESVDAEPELAESTSDVTTEVPESSAPEVAVGDLVFIDADRDGVQDVGDLGLGGVEVRLVDDSGTVVDEDVSDSSGRYELAFPSSGSYSLELLIPAGYRPTLLDVGPDDAVDSDVDPADVQVGPVETIVRIDLDAADVARLDVDVDIGLVTEPEEPPAASTTTTVAPLTTEPSTTEPSTTEPAPTEPSTTEPPPTEPPPTVTPTTAEPPPAASPPTEPTTTEASATTSVPPG